MVRWSVLAAVAIAAVGAAFVTGAAVPAKTAKPPVDVKADAKADAKQLVVVGQKTGYFNMAKVMREYKRAKTAVERLNVRKDRLVANLVGMRNMYIELEAALKTATNEKRKEELTSGVILLRRQIEDADREIHKILNNRASIILGELHDELRSVVGAVARDNGLVAVLAYPDATTPEEADNPMVKEMRLKPPAAHPFYLDPSVEYTDEILRRLNDKFAAEND